MLSSEQAKVHASFVDVGEICSVPVYKKKWTVGCPR